MQVFIKANHCHHLCVLALALLTNASWGGEVLFLDGGYTEFCASVAKQVERPEQVSVTGSRLSVAPLEICNRAVAEKTVSRSEAAGNYNNRGVIYFAQSAYAEARSDFEQAIRLQPNLAVAHVNLGYTYVAEQRWAEALGPLDRGIELGPEEPAKAYYNRGIANEESGNIAEAYRDYLKAAELDPAWEAPRRELTRFTVRRS
ncbi:MAG: tetratricopeptide repeat protein [Pseudomonadales bacterium]|jgi:tetratricopeptide (TPR) repeat protein|nr:tetratricopeptide repeat protein [Pseudomonadales bacterium]